MLRSRNRTFVVTVLVLLVLGAWIVQLHFVSDNAGATVFQRGNEAYLFLGAGHTGWRFPALLFPLVIAKGYLHIPADISDQNSQSLVIRVTPEGVQRWINETADAAFITPFQDGFYGLCPGAALCKWTEKGFVLATPEGEERITIDDLQRGSLDNKVVNGWLTRELKLTPGDHFEIKLDDGTTIAVENYAERDWGLQNVRVDLLRSGKAPETIYRAVGIPRLVTKSAYERFFPKR